MTGEDARMTGEDGVLGNLPRTRPGVSSPRRAAARKATAGTAQGKEQPSDAPATAPDAPATAAGKPGEEHHQASGFEELARAGAGLAAVTVAAGAQLTGRLLGEMTKAVGRR